MNDPDFIVSSILSELKDGNKRKDCIIRAMVISLVGVIIASIAAVLAINQSYLNYLAQYDFTSWDASTISASGIYTLVDSEGNVVAQDLDPATLEALMEELVNGEGEEGNSSGTN